jgi:nicotinamidase-related amidase
MIWDSAESWGLREIRLAACEQLKGYRVTEGSWYTVHEFEHESAPTAELWRRVEQRLAEAERVFRSCFFRRVRDTVYVYDFRTDAHGQLTRLDGEAARLFLACVDHPRATVELVCLCPDVANARSMLSELSEAGLLFETRDRWLALPTKIYPAVRRFLADRIEVDAGLLPSPFEAAPGERGPIEERRALLIIDVQRAFLNEHTQHIASLIRQHLEAHSHEYNLIAFTVFQNREDSLFHTWHGYKGCMGSPDTDIAGELAEFATPENVFSKAGFSALSSLELLDILRTQRIGSVSLAGLDTDACILATAMDAMDHNIRPRVLLHLCASSAGPEGHRQGLEILGRSVDPWLSE